MRTRYLLGLAVALAASGCAAPAATGALGSGPEPTTMELRLVTQCGLTTVEAAGHVWTFDEQHPDEAPRGFTRPFDDGTFTILDGDRARYESSRGVELTLRRGGAPPEDCL